MFKNKTILITGGTGSFGNAVLKELLIKGIKEIKFLVGMKRNRMICVEIMVKIS